MFEERCFVETGEYLYNSSGGDPRSEDFKHMK